MMTRPPLSHNLALPLQHAVRLLEEEALPLKDLARRVGWSGAHLQKQFKQSLGMSPAEYVRALKHRSLRDRLTSFSVTRSIVDAGYGSSSRVYEDTQRLGMTPGEFARGGKGLTIAWGHVPTSLGHALVAATARGVCAVLLEDDEATALAQLRQEFPLATLQRSEEGEGDFLQPRLEDVANYLAGKPARVDLHLIGTAFQLRVWEALMHVPRGTTLSYQQLAHEAGNGDATRAAATACARNRLAMVVPCHRIVRQDGSLGGYRWGLPTKQALLSQEQAESGTPGPAERAPTGLGPPSC